MNGMLMAGGYVAGVLITLVVAYFENQKKFGYKGGRIEHGMSGSDAITLAIVWPIAGSIWLVARTSQKFDEFWRTKRFFVPEPPARLPDESQLSKR